MISFLVREPRMASSLGSPVTENSARGLGNFSARTEGCQLASHMVMENQRIQVGILANGCVQADAVKPRR